jgi:hypothetical protein
VLNAAIFSWHERQAAIKMHAAAAAATTLFHSGGASASADGFERIVASSARAPARLSQLQQRESRHHHRRRPRDGEELRLGKKTLIKHEARFLPSSSDHGKQFSLNLEASLCRVLPPPSPLRLPVLALCFSQRGIIDLFYAPYNAWWMKNLNEKTV